MDSTHSLSSASSASSATVAQSTLSVRNPRTGHNDYIISPLGAEALQYLVGGLRAAQPAWVALGVEGRIDALQRWKAAAERHKPAIIEALIADTGRKWESVLEADLLFSSIDRWCANARTFFTEAAPRASAVPFVEVFQNVVPYSVVGVISPWNFPLLLSLIDALPALVAGCAVVVKPSEITPRFIQPMMQAIAEVPELAGVLAYIEGAGATGAVMIPVVDLVCFTGSVATGKSVYKTAAEHFVPVFLELGGKDAALVFEGADLDRATSAILWGATANAGQSCLSVERVYVEQTIMQEFTNLIVEKAQRLSLCFPDVNVGQIAPIISAKQVDIINDHLSDAVSKGASVLTGSVACENHGGGMWCLPTVLTNVSHTMRVMTEETFGPIIPLMPFANEDEAIALANGTEFGLSGAVFARTWEEAQRIASRMDAGAVSINDAALTAVIQDGEKQSFKLSGIGGTRMGPNAIRRFVRQRTFLTKMRDVASPWWYS
jgi:succinate-semialdehyde dehydrogenase / glutarate-semialdehyde dehydrogenase